MHNMLKTFPDYFQFILPLNKVGSSMDMKLLYYNGCDVTV